MSFGYQSSGPCRVCGGHKNNQEEPRFGYTVCEDHQFVPPAYLDDARKQWLVDPTKPFVIPKSLR